MKNSFPFKIADRVETLPPSGIRAFFDLVIGMKDIISLGVGEPDFDTPWTIRESAIYSIEHGHTTYTSNKGLLELRKKIAQHLNKKFKVDYDPENEILITVGVSEAMDLAIRALLNPHEKVIVPEPCYVSYSPMVSLAGGNPVAFITEKKHDFKIDIKSLEKYKSSGAKAIILNYPSNPTGTSYTQDELSKLSRTIQKMNLLVISDEIYSDLSYDIPHTCFASLPEMKGQTLLLNGFSKGYAMTGWRIGYAAGPRPLIEAMTKIHQYTIMCAPIMGQWAACEAIKNGDSVLAPMIKEYEKRRNFVVESLNEMGLDCHKPAGAFYAFPSIQKTEMDSMSFAHQLLEKEKVAVVPGTAFGSSGEGFIRLSYATGMDRLKEALSRIKKFINV
ncbi:MAG: aminotransferase class I/II-fold pyridoxal phosphate-dependent enzyme [Chlamydiae bacterium]|nr:aminotransferase class I/II-fold pyridoxal phosphate-dependent enzyme [Chlamydiota bacterium]MBI3278089.1 aminotransferase class I/II-fold pyridoxal phosphate-dependent enzyme [Chlamydiota bacterium]